MVKSWYRRPHYGGDYPSREAGYNLKVSAALTTPTKIDEATARTILELLQAGTGLGEYDQIPNGRHQIVIEGKDHSRPGHTQRWHDGTTVLDLGIDSMERGATNMLELYRNADDQWYKDLYAERISNLAKASREPLTSVVILLQANQEDAKGIDAGEHYDLSGWAGNFSPGNNQINPFLENSGYLLESVARGLGGRDLTPTSIPVEVPEGLRRAF